MDNDDDDDDDNKDIDDDDDDDKAEDDDFDDEEDDYHDDKANDDHYDSSNDNEITIFGGLNKISQSETKFSKFNFSRKNNIFVSAGSDRTFKLWDAGERAYIDT
jgi:hypothetical protein